MHTAVNTEIHNILSSILQRQREKKQMKERRGIKKTNTIPNIFLPFTYADLCSNRTLIICSPLSINLATVYNFLC
jgi:hypothetical protein